MRVAGVTAGRIGLAAFVAASIGLIAATRVYNAIPALRFKIVEAHRQAESGAVTIDLTEDRFPGINRLAPPFALIARPQLSGSGRPLTIAVDGHEICTTDMTSGTTQRIDCVVREGWRPYGDHQVGMSAGGDWTLEYFELATHHGNSYGFNNLYILPTGASGFIGPTTTWTLAVAAFAFVVMLVPASRAGRRPLRLTLQFITGLFAAGILIVLVAPLVSPYLLVLSPGTLLRWLTIALGLRLWTIGRVFARSERPVMAAARAAGVAFAVAFIVSMPARHLLDVLYRGNYSGFLNIPEEHFNANPVLNGRDDIRRSVLLLDGGGYDGQFMYFAALDPLLRALSDRPAEYGTFFDLVPYRYGRIGFPLLARGFSFGDWLRLPATMFWIVVTSIGLLAGVVAWSAEQRGLSPMMGALVAFIPGFWASLQWSLPEPVAALTIAAAVLCLMSDRPLAAGVLFAGSLLIRETGAIVVIACVVERLITRSRREAMLVGTIALTPLALWRLFLGWRLYPVSGLDAFLPFSPSGMPLAGILDMWQRIGEGRYAPHLPQFAVSGVWFPLLLFAAIALLAALLATHPSAPAAAGLLYGVSALTLRYDMVWLHVGNAERTTYEIWVMLLLAMFALRERPRWLRVSLGSFWAASAIYIVWGAVDAVHIHEQLAAGVRSLTG